MTNLVIDIGNTFTKVALFNNRELIRPDAFADLNQQTIEAFIEGYKIDHSIVSSVEDPSFNLEMWLSSISNFSRFSTASKTNVRIKYKTPESLGLDRYAAVIGANHLYKNEDTLVIDAGTCVTYDFIDREGSYSGGIISPGLRMRFKAMNHFTERLPLIESDTSFNETAGNDTRTCIIAGAQNGLINEAIGFIHSYKKQYPDLKVILCGGDASFFDTQLKNSIFAPIVKTEPHLVLTGLNEVIYQIND